MAPSNLLTGMIAMRRARLACGTLWTIALATAAGCAATGGWGGTAATQPAAGAAGPSIELRTALIPDATPQPVQIHVSERRQTTGEDLPVTTHDLALDLAATLTRTATEPNGEVQAELEFKSIRLKLGVPNRPETMLSFDSNTDKPGQGNPLADMMVHVADAKLSLRIGPTGRLRELHGLDGRWRQADLLLAPPGLLTAQWLFRDAAMAELVAEALFPPMPASPVRVGDAWEVDVPANLPLAARLNSHLRATLSQVTKEGGSPTARIETTGRIEPAPEILKTAPAALRPTVRSSSHRIFQSVRPGSRSLIQAGTRSLDVLLTLTPPEGDQRREMRVMQERTLESRRGDYVNAR